VADATPSIGDAIMLCGSTLEPLGGLPLDFRWLS